MSDDVTGVSFSNDVHYTETLNPFTYHSFFNGGGVAVGDINNDGLIDIFFTSNMGANKLYLNLGNFQFQDISAKAQISTDGLWYTGATFVDINGDGFLDIYVCRGFDSVVGWRGNELYINNGDLTFTDKASEYGLSKAGFSMHAVFFDYDNDNDLDCYLLSNSGNSGSEFYTKKDQRLIMDPQGGNRLMRNDNNHFTDVSAEAGIYGSVIGFGLGVTIADINRDGWQDMYVSNDFFERDYFYLNNQDGTFTECLERFINEISMFSMGADIADINNDGYADICVTDMLPEEEGRVKTKTTFENWEKYQNNIRRGYHKQFIRNSLQLNRGPLSADEETKNMHFSEIGRLANVQASDWSWGVLIADLDNDGQKDMFVANGMLKDVTDQDFIQFIANDSGAFNRANFKKLIDLLPSEAIPNYAFHNNGDLTFTNRSAEWGLGLPGFSNGSAYADLDNDGDLDIITNNLNAVASLYRNNTEKVLPENSFFKIILEGEGNNRFGLGTKATVFYNGTLAYQEQLPSRGFQSCVDNRLNFGIGKAKKIDSVKVEWPGGKVQLFKNVVPNQVLIVKEHDAQAAPQTAVALKNKTLLASSADNYGLDFIHHENAQVDFNRDKLIFHMLSTPGPHLAGSDVNGDGLEDIFFCGASDQAGVLYTQGPDGKFKKSNQPAFEKDKRHEDTDAHFADIDGDGDQDLLVSSGGNIFIADSTILYNRLYLNSGKGNFASSLTLPRGTMAYENTSTINPADIDGDGDIDLFIGTRSLSNNYGHPCNGYILVNDGKGNLTDATKDIAPALKEIGMITDSEWADLDRDGKQDLVLTGEFMPVTVFHQEGGKLVRKVKEAKLDSTNGFWNTITVRDINRDGFPDIIAGNHGLNSRIRASREKPVCLYSGDLDANGTNEQILCTYNGGKQYPLTLRHDLVGILPFLKKKYLNYKDYRYQTMQDIFTSEQLGRALTSNAYELRTGIFLNNQKGGFTFMPLPMEAQFSPTFSILVRDFNNDGNDDLLLGGNFYESKPEVGIYDASYGLMLTGDGKGNFNPLPISESNVFIQGAVRDMMWLQTKRGPVIVVAKNNAPVQLLKP